MTSERYFCFAYMVAVCIYGRTVMRAEFCIFKVTRKELLARAKSKPPADPEHKAVPMLQVAFLTLPLPES